MNLTEQTKSAIALQIEMTKPKQHVKARTSCDV